MTREEKKQAVKELTEQIRVAPSFYLADSATLNVAEINKFRRLCFEKNVSFKVVKNTLLKKALEACEDNYSELYDILVGPTAIMFSEAANSPAKVIKQFREDYDKPLLKAAYIDTEVFLGDDKVDELSKLKSKEELLGDVLLLLQSPMTNVVGSLQSAERNLAGLIKTLSEKEEN